MSTLISIDIELQNKPQGDYFGTVLSEKVKTSEKPQDYVKDKVAQLTALDTMIAGQVISQAA